MSPEHQFQIRTRLKLLPTLELDAALSYVDRLDTLNVPAYFRLDTGLEWHLSEGVTVSLVLQNLLDEHHLEFVDNVTGISSTQVKRSVYAKTTWKF